MGLIRISKTQFIIRGIHFTQVAALRRRGRRSGPGRIPLAKVRYGAGPLSAGLVGGEARFQFHEGMRVVVVHAHDGYPCLRLESSEYPLDQYLAVITAYLPDQDEWSADFRKRKNP